MESPGSRLENCPGVSGSKKYRLRTSGFLAVSRNRGYQNFDYPTGWTAPFTTDVVAASVMVLGLNGALVMKRHAANYYQP